MADDTKPDVLETKADGRQPAAEDAPVFVNEQPTPVTVFDADRRAVTVHPYALRARHGDSGGTFFVRGDHYRQFLGNKGGLSTFRGPLDDAGVPRVGPEAPVVRGHVGPVGVVAGFAAVRDANRAVPTLHEATDPGVTIDRATLDAVVDATRDATPVVRAQVAAYVLKLRDAKGGDKPVLEPALEAAYGEAARRIADEVEPSDEPLPGNDEPAPAIVTERGDITHADPEVVRLSTEARDDAVQAEADERAGDTNDDGPPDVSAADRAAARKAIKAKGKQK